MNLASYDVIVISTSGGKDSQAAMGVLARRARDQGAFGRLVTLHCDLGRAVEPERVRSWVM